MARRSSLSGKKAALENLRVQLSQSKQERFDAETRRKMVQQLVSMMILNLHKRGRPKKSEGLEVSHAV